MNTGKGLKGLTLYGDDKNLIAWGIEGDKLILKVVKDDIESVLYDSAFASKEIYLKLELNRGVYSTFIKVWMEKHGNLCRIPLSRVNP